MGDEKTLFDATDKEGEIPNIDDLCKTVSLQENSELEDVHVHALRSENVHAFFDALAVKCGKGKCEECGAREFCFTAPRSMTAEIIDETIKWLNVPAGDKP